MPAGGTPIIVPASAAGGGGTPTPGAGPAGATGGAPGCWFMSMVPLNLGAAAPLRLNPHFVHVDAVSEFCVPQFGQNTHHLRQRFAGSSREARPRAKVAAGYLRPGGFYKRKRPPAG